jgi:hypothetical protein
MAFILLIAFSQNVGKSDFGFRINSIDVKLSQKLPPSIAFELLSPEKELPAPTFHGDVIILRVGYPEIAPIRLEEISFGALENSAANKFQLPIVRTELLTPKGQEIELEEEGFTEEEKHRLRLAKLDSGLEITDLLPRHEVSFSERVQEVIRAEASAGAGSGQVREAQKDILVQGGTPTIESNHPKSKGTIGGNYGTEIYGEIEFSRDGSLYFGDQHFIDVRRFEEGIPKEVAQVDLLKGTFSMNIRATRGIIIGRLTNNRGGVEGEGIISVADLLASKDHRLVLKKLASREPIRRPRSAYGPKAEGNDGSISLAGMNSSPETETTSYDVNAFDSTSEFVVEAKTMNHLPTISMVNLKSGRDLVVLPERMVKGLTEILSEQDIQLDLERGDSLIWGTVLANGKPVEGATIVASQGRTSYFGGLYLPDQTRVKTSENGMFAVVVRNPGWNDLFIELVNGKNVHLNALVYPGKVTQVDADIPISSSPVTVRTFDALSGEPIRAAVEFQQLSDTVDTGAEAAVIIDLPKTTNVSFLLVDVAPPFKKVRISYTHLQDYLHIPLVTQDWFDGLRAQSKTNEEINTGSIIGFVQGDDYIIEIPNKESQATIAYFDSQGLPTQSGVPGGGFAIFNLEMNQSNIIARSMRTKRQISRIVRPDSQLSQVVNFAFE